MHSKREHCHNGPASLQRTNSVVAAGVTACLHRGLLALRSAPAKIRTVVPVLQDTRSREAVAEGARAEACGMRSWSQCAEQRAGARNTTAATSSPNPQHHKTTTSAPVVLWVGGAEPHRSGGKQICLQLPRLD
jgi:hypothetical protein